MGSLAVGTAIATGALPRTALAAPVRIRIGWVRVPVSTGPLILAKKDILKNFGKSYIAESVKFGNSTLLAAGITSGEIELGPLAYYSMSLAIQNGNGKNDDLRIIADEMQDGVEGHGTNEFMVLKDSPIKTLADLKGKVLGAFVIGSPTDIAMRVMLRKAGLEANRDYTLIEAPYGEQWKLLADKKVAMIPAVVPFNYDPRLQAIAKPLFTQKEALGVTQLTVYAAKAGFIQKNRAAVVDFLEDMIIAMRWYEDPKNHEEVVAIVARLNGEPPAGWDWTFTKRDQFRDPNVMPNLAALKKNFEVQKEFGLLKADFDPYKYADLSMVTEAAKRLK